MLSRFCSEKFSLYIVFKSTLGLTAFLSHSLHRQNKEDVDFLRKNFWTQDLLFSSLQRTELGRGKEWKEVGLFFFLPPLEGQSVLGHRWVLRPKTIDTIWALITSHLHVSLRYQSQFYPFLGFRQKLQRPRNAQLLPIRLSFLRFPAFHTKEDSAYWKGSSHLKKVFKEVLVWGF